MSELNPFPETDNALESLTVVCNDCTASCGFEGREGICPDGVCGLGGIGDVGPNGANPPNPSCVDGISPDAACGLGGIEGVEPDGITLANPSWVMEGETPLLGVWVVAPTEAPAGLAPNQSLDKLEEFEFGRGPTILPAPGRP